MRNAPAGTLYLAAGGYHLNPALRPEPLLAEILGVIAVTGMARNTDANIVADAIAYARLGKDDPRVTAHRDTRRLVATYQGLGLSLRNIETAIACAGFRANDIPANLGRPDAVAHGWFPVTL